MSPLLAVSEKTKRAPPFPTNTIYQLSKNGGISHHRQICRLLKLSIKTEKYMEKAMTKETTPTETVRGWSISTLILYMR